MNILVGTASWTDKTLIECGRFYPRGFSKPEARLRYYASQFPMVEIDTSFYAIPSVSVSTNWALRTPPDFVFNIKAFRVFTGHHTSAAVLGKDMVHALGDLAKKRTLYYKDFPAEILDELWRRFIVAVAPLKNAGKLAAVHFQFAPWILRNRDGHAYVRECVDRMEGHHLAVEFRNATWFAEDYIAASLEFEHELGVSHTVVDAPQGVPFSVPAVWEATNTKLAVVRLHGRNAATWNVKGQAAPSDRFNYDYPEDELAAMVSSIRRLAARVDMLQVIFNNNQEDQGQRNAKTLIRLLGDAD